MQSSLKLLALALLALSYACSYDFDQFAAEGLSGNAGAAGSGGSGAASNATGSGGHDRGGQGGSSAGSGTTTTCQGVWAHGACWYLGDEGASCTATCTTHGGSSPRSVASVGTASQGGNVANCAEILGLLGADPNVNSGTRTDSRGLGCHQYDDGLALTSWWLSAPSYRDDASEGSTLRACGCVQ